ncbi:guanylate kinase [Pseudofulvimonas gallinarii]|uniref:Guanylate kinase n=1 Tax=Pseudofulvimonas gallinarii TaxID=634155 RepID=A0A4S3KYC7_9GAMM|nr:guanylate kinase [Pseudofulvimonas gallinarii]TCS93682.1 guanylate kinase [Pseudofulvimonas gallinarii]THD14226.1 guanylate kinase [Pseudofulvimonas gallinarii]
MTETGTLFIVAAPSGAGKTSLVRALIEDDPSLALSVSYTSRPPRPAETDGVHYHFVDRQVFLAMAAAGDFYEYAEVHGDLKGTARSAVQPFLDAGRDVLLEIDWQGARQVRAQQADCRSIFVLPPSSAELERRLRSRAQDSEAVIARRLANSREEIAHAHEFDYIVVNDDFQTALADIKAVIRAQRLRQGLQADRHAGLIAELLGDPAV